MKWPAYPTYQPSGIDWIGGIPEHWTMPALATRYHIDLGKMLHEGRITGDHLLPYLRNVDVQWGRISLEDLPQMDVAPTERTRFTVSSGDLLVCEGGEVGRAAIVPDGLQELAYQKALHRIRPKLASEVPRFLFYLLYAASHGGVFEAGGNPNTIPHLTGEKLRRYRFPSPQYDEQRAIADFLDAQTAKIDALVAKKRTLIEKLAEKRSALISRTVSRGLTTESDEPPSHWRVLPLKHAIRFVEGPGILAIDFADEGVPLLRIACLGSRMASLSGCGFLAPADVKRRWARFRVRAGDLLISGSASTGLCAEVDEAVKGAVPYTGIIIVRSIQGISTKEYLRWFFLSDVFRVQTDHARTGSTIQHFGPSHLSKMTLAVPPVPEQLAIADFLDRETAKIDALVAKIETAIERLLEYRAALITAAVTGKIDVRGWVRASTTSTSPETGATPAT